MSRRSATHLEPLPSDQDASGRTLGDEELALVGEAIRSGTLTSTKGRMVKRLERRFAERLGVRHAFACASGTAAVHVAVAALDPEPGEEIVTTPVTDMGALSPILYQGAVPVFADVDPRTLDPTAETLAARLSERTRALVATHLFGNPCEMDAILALAHERGLPVIEDCAQAYGASFGGRPVGTLGAVGCFSLQQGKHITSGEGGLVVTDDDALARRMFLLVNKGWGYGDSNPDHELLALNYRLSELQGAVALAQLDKLDAVGRARAAAAEEMTKRLEGVPGVEPPFVHPRAVHGYWKYALRVDAGVVAGGASGLGAALREQGIACAPRYIQKPAFECGVFRDRRTFGRSGYPFSLARPEALDWSRERFPGAYAGLDRVLVLPWNERYTTEHVARIAGAVRGAAERLAGAGS